MEMMTAKDVKRRTDFGGSLQPAVNSQRQIVQHHVQLGNDMMRVADRGVTVMTNELIKSNKLAGKKAGLEGATLDEHGVPKGFEDKGGPFAWSNAYNVAATSAFEGVTSSQSNSFANNIAVKSDGNTNLYKQGVNKARDEAMEAVKDPEQKAYIKAAYDTAQSKYLNKVAATGLKNTKKRISDGYEASRVIFRDDLARKNTLIATNDAAIYKLKQEKPEGYEDKVADLRNQNADHYMSRKELIKAREQSTVAGIGVGALNMDEVNMTLNEDVMKSVIQSKQQELTIASSAYKNEDGTINIELASQQQAEVIKRYIAQPNKMLNDRENIEVQKAMNEHVAALNSADNVQAGREARDLKAFKSNANTTIRSNILKINTAQDQKGYDPESIENTTNRTQAMNQINEAYSFDLISSAERETYIDELLNGSPVKSDNMYAYGEIANNVESYTVTDIVNRGDLTDNTKKELIKRREKWNTEGEEWMKEPDYIEGKKIIRVAYGFPESSILPESLTGEKKKAYLEMNALVNTFRGMSSEKIAAGYRNQSVAIADELINKASQDARSHLYNTKEEKLNLTKDNASKASEKRGVEIDQILKEQNERFPKTTYDQDVYDDEAEKKKNEPKKSTDSSGDIDATKAEYMDALYNEE